MVCMVGWAHPYVRREALPIEAKIRYDTISTSVKERMRGSKMAIISWPFPNEKATSLSFIYSVWHVIVRVYSSPADINSKKIYI